VDRRDLPMQHGYHLASLHSGQSATIYTSMAVTQDAITLYGFLLLAEKKMFLQLQKVSGIGPKVALSLLSTLPPDRLARAVADGDATALAKAPGLGKKGAQKIILELKGSLDLSQVEGASAPAQSPVDTGAQQVVEGLISLGWRQQDALDAVERACRDHGIATPIAEQDVPRVLKLALTELDRGR
ncbi:Holliday junction branch migration protein RuvA, partial [Bifidobacterium apri]|uniref:Holliday junction branch migration protein RuvA n=1 Tax=Bifidobacterium apri TaxID=1769423 RepID=UPI003990F9FF